MAGLAQSQVFPALRALFTEAMRKTTHDKARQALRSLPLKNKIIKQNPEHYSFLNAIARYDFVR